MIGATLGNYRIEDQIGEGGMATVYKAYDPDTDRYVAIKVLPEKLSKDPKFRERFRRETKAIANLEHIHILPIHAYGEEGNIAYLVMRYLQAGTLTERIEQGPLPLDEVSRLLRQIARALDFAHTQDILHRDVKPSNVLLDTNGNAFLTDFGIAKLIGGTLDLTEGAMLGTPQYMSPEQCRGQEPLTSASDIYSLGIMLYEMITGHTPFEAETPLTVMFQQVKDSPPSPRHHRPDLPEAVEQVILKVLAKEPKERYPTASDLAVAFAEAVAAQPADVPCPYKGLAAFEVEDAIYFFGRESLVAELTARLSNGPFLAVVGPSGSGKSSVIRAGLLPALRQGALPHSDKWRIIPLTPGQHPLEELAAQISSLNGSSAGALLKDLEADERALNLAIKQILADQPLSVHLLLLVDHFEELFTLCRDEAERERFIAALLYTIQATNSRAMLVLTLRADFYGHCAAYRQLAGKLQDNVLVGPMTGEELRQVIIRPAAAVGLELETGLVDAIIRDVANEPGALPLMSHALLETWQRRRGRTLTLSGYSESGGVRGAIAKTAETIYQQLPPEQQNIARNIFLRLTELGEGTQDTRRRAMLNELISQAEAEAVVKTVLNTLTEARLITTGADTVEVAHEALIREWPTLRRWLDENREGLRIHRRLTEAAQEWATMGRDPNELYRGARLAAAREWAETHLEALNPLEREFLETSQATEEEAEREIEAARQRELAQAQALAAERERVAEEQRQRAEEQAKANRRLRWLTLGLGVILIIAVISAVLAVRQTNRAETERQRAEEQARLALSRQLVLQSRDQLDNQLDLALLLSLEAGRIENSAEARSSLLTGLQFSPHLTTYLHNHNAPVNSVVVSPDGQTLVSAGDDRTIIFWDAKNGQPLGSPLAGHTTPILGLSFSPNGQTLASSSRDGVIILWDVKTRQQLDTAFKGQFATFSPDGQILAATVLDSVILWDIATGQKKTSLETGDIFGIQSLAFSPDGKIIAANSNDRIFLWDISTMLNTSVASGQALGGPLTGHTKGVNSLAFNPDTPIAKGGQLLASGSDDGTIILWDVASRQPIGNPLSSGAEAVTSLTFSHDSQTLISGRDDGTIMLWDVNTRKSLGSPLTGHASAVQSLAFSSDGHTMVSGGKDNNVILWDIAIGQPLGRFLTGAQSSVRSADLSPDGQRVVSGHDNGAIILWDAATGQPISQPLVGHTVSVRSVTFSPDGNLLASGSADNSIVLWDTATGQQLGQPFTKHTNAVNSVAFSSDAKILASGSADNTIILWDVATGQPRHEPLAGHTAAVRTVAFSPDGKTLASGSDNNAIILWDVTTGQPLDQPLVGHNFGVSSLVFSPNGELLASSSVDTTIILWDIKSRQPTGEPLIKHIRTVNSVVFTPDSQTLVSGSLDTTIILWDVPSHQPIGPPLAGHFFEVLDVAFSSDGRTMLSASLDTMILWDVSLESWQARACKIAARNLTQAEWEQYLGDTPYQVTCPDAPASEQ